MLTWDILTDICAAINIAVFLVMLHFRRQSIRDDRYRVSRLMMERVNSGDGKIQINRGDHTLVLECTRATVEHYTVGKFGDLFTMGGPLNLTKHELRAWDEEQIDENDRRRLVRRHRGRVLGAAGRGQVEDEAMRQRNPEARCENCTYWECNGPVYRMVGTPEPTYGWCQRHAPVANAGTQGYYVARLQRHWCGDHPEFWVEAEDAREDAIPARKGTSELG